MKDYNGFSPGQRLKAYRWLQDQYARGARRRPTRCDACGQTEGIIEAHSEDYSAPYGDHIGEWSLCYRCHMMVHNRQHAPDAWRQYRAALAGGTIFAAFHKRNYWGFRHQHIARWEPVIGASGPAHPDILAEIEA